MIQQVSRATTLGEKCGIDSNNWLNDVPTVASLDPGSIRKCNYFTIITVHFALSETFLETLPITNLGIPFRPLLPITIRFTFCLFANSTIP